MGEAEFREIHCPDCNLKNIVHRGASLECGTETCRRLLPLPPLPGDEFLSTADSRGRHTVLRVRSVGDRTMRDRWVVTDAKGGRWLVGPRPMSEGITYMAFERL